MSQHYSDPSRAEDEHALPDVEVFYHVPGIEDVARDDVDDTPMVKGWYWWYCFPGCLPDSEPNGPFDSRAAALADVREQTDDDGDVDEDEDDSEDTQ